jgi:rhamnosyltransferase subunit B
LHVVLATIGTDGDVFPSVGLGIRLRAREHKVTLAAPEPYRVLAEEVGLEIAPLATAEEMARMIEDPNLWHPLRSGRMMARWGGGLIPRHYRILTDLLKPADSVLVANPGVLAARLVQEKLGCPTATLLLQPGVIPSSVAPPEMPAGLTLPRRMPRPVGKLYWAAVDAVAYLLVARALNRFRATIGLGPVRALFRWWLSPDLVIGLFPKWYAPPPTDWPAQLRLAGFGRYDGDRGGPLDAELRSFCLAGRPPVVFTLGTGMMHAAEFFRAAVAACDLLGVRGLLFTKYPQQLPERLPSEIRHCRFAPFRQLLPLCAAIVHHGGIGTTAAALTAGVPQLILPLAWDQPDNAMRVQRLKVGDRLKPRHRTARHLARALGRLMTAKIRDRCAAVAERVDGDGLELAARWVEGLAKAGPATNRTRPWTV